MDNCGSVGRQFSSYLGERTAVSRILLLGGSGFVGRTLRDEFRRYSNLEVVVTSTSPKIQSQFDHESHVCWQIGSSVDCGPCDYIIHAATPASAQLNASEPETMIRLNTQSMFDVIDTARRWGNCPRVVFLSSGAVYGVTSESQSLVPEDWTGACSTLSSKSAYGEGKRAAEVILSIATEHGLVDGVVARLFAFSGKYLPMDRHFALGNFVRDALSGTEIVIRGDGQTIRSYLDQVDLARWITRMLEVGPAEHVYHVGSEIPISMRDLANLVSNRAYALLGRKTNVRLLNQKSNLDGILRYVPSTKMTREALGLSETISLSDSIDQMLLGADGDPH